MSEITITKENFEQEVINSDKPVLVDFWATWCGPCKMLAPTIAQIAEEHPEIKVGKVNTDEQMELSMQFGIMSIPTVILFKGGKAVDKLIGYRAKEDFEAMIRK